MFHIINKKNEFNRVRYLFIQSSVRTDVNILVEYYETLYRLWYFKHFFLLKDVWTINFYSVFTFHEHFPLFQKGQIIQIPWDKAPKMFLIFFPYLSLIISWPLRSSNLWFPFINKKSIKNEISETITISQ